MVKLHLVQMFSYLVKFFAYCAIALSGDGKIEFEIANPHFPDVYYNKRNENVPKNFKQTAQILQTVLLVVFLITFMWSTLSITNAINFASHSVVNELRREHDIDINY